MPSSSTPTAIILAAGQGTRLRPHTDDRPKCMVDVGGVPILTRCIDTCSRAGIRDYVIVVGYRPDAIRESACAIPGIDVRLAVNPRFESTGTAVSLQLGLAASPARDVLLIEGDVVISPGALDRLLGADAPDATLVDDFEGHSGSLVTLDGGDRVTAWLHEQARPADFDVRGTWKTVNLTRLQRSSAASGLRGALAEAVAEHGDRAPLERAMERWVRSGAEIRGIRTAGLPWVEIDTPEDLAIAARLFAGAWPAERGEVDRPVERVAYPAGRGSEH